MRRPLTSLRVLEFKGDLDSAEMGFRWAIEIDKEDGYADWLRGCILEYIGFEDAEMSFRVVIYYRSGSRSIRRMATPIGFSGASSSRPRRYKDGL